MLFKRFSGFSIPLSICVDPSIMSSQHGDLHTGNQHTRAHSGDQAPYLPVAQLLRSDRSRVTKPSVHFIEQFVMPLNDLRK